MKSWGQFVIYPNTHWLVLKNSCQIFDYLASELLSYMWDTPHLIGLGEKQNPSPPNEVKKLEILSFPVFLAFSIQLHDLVPVTPVSLSGTLNLELGSKEVWGIHTGGGGGHV